LRVINVATRPLALLSAELTVLGINDAARKLLVGLAVPASLGVGPDEQGPVERVVTGDRVLRSTLVPVDDAWLLELDDVTQAHQEQALASRLTRQLHALTDLSKCSLLLEDGFPGFAQQACKVLAPALEVERIDLWLLDVASELFDEQGLELRHAASSMGPATEQGLPATKALLERISSQRQVDGLPFVDVGLVSPQSKAALITGVFSMGALAGVAVCEASTAREWGPESRALVASFAETLALGFETTRRRVAEANVQLRVNQLEVLRIEAEVANRAKSEFLATMSHEIRTPMNGVMGFTNLLLEGALEPEQRGFADTIRSSAESLLVIINDILDFSKIEAGELTLESVPFDLEAVLGQATELCLARADEKQLTLTLNVSREVPQTLTGDPNRVRQVLLNLLGNAIKFTPRGSVSVRVSQRDGFVRVSVQDTGIGMTGETCTRLFHRFMQADSSTTRKYGGTGLGLAISRRLVELMGGTIEVESSLGAGSAFTFTLPCAEARAVAVTPPPVRVTLVEPNAEVAAMWALAIGPGFRSVARAGELAQLKDAPGVVVVEADDPAAAAVLPALGGVGGVVARAWPGGAALVQGDVVVPRSTVRAAAMREAVAQAVARRAGFAPLPTARPEVKHAQPWAGRQVLLVEDNPVNQRLAERLLSRAGCVVTLAENGLQALDRWSHARFDLVLMDCNMPELDGLEATRRIRALEGPRAHTPIIALTADAMESDREACLLSGMDDYLSKPIREERLQEMLSRHLDGQPQSITG
jgi:signal transduction histidine kinase/ActR/RegA family two-component response regulator